MWTATQVRLLRTEGLRWTVRRFAARLGVAHRTIWKWEAGVTPRPTGQAILDTVLRHATEEQRVRYAAALIAAGTTPVDGLRLDLTGRARMWVSTDPPAVCIWLPAAGIVLHVDPADPGAATALLDLADSLVNLADKLPRPASSAGGDDATAEEHQFRSDPVVRLGVELMTPATAVPPLTADRLDDTIARARREAVRWR